MVIMPCYTHCLMSYNLCAKYFYYSNCIDFKGSLQNGVTLQLTGKVKRECPLLDTEGLSTSEELKPIQKLLTKCALEGREAFYIVPYENKHIPDM